jgi:CcmD family protein
LKLNAARPDTFSVKNWTKLLPVVFLMWCQNALAQQPVADGVEMADRLRADGKIWVVVAVVAVVFVGIIVYLIRLDGQVSKLEKEIKRKS